MIKYEAMTTNERLGEIGEPDRFPRMGRRGDPSDEGRSPPYAAVCGFKNGVEPMLEASWIRA